ncbi:MAG: M24 family metallopeptidase [Candidatus Sungbacteria bacterium]|nr:M24 family metallopeptidase [Candidatus Sungbacteria bacterium]
MKKALILYGATAFGMPEFSPDLRWRTGGYSVPDPIFFAEIDGKKYLLASSLEIERAAKEAKVDEVVPLEKYISESKEKNLPISVLFLKEHSVTDVTVSHTVRYGLGKVLGEHFAVEVRPPPFYPERAVKTVLEIAEIEKAQRAVEKAVHEGILFLRECQIKGNLLFHAEFGDAPIASYHLRKIIDDTLYILGYIGIESIVACGAEAADPHAIRSGLLRPCEPIVMDVFPRSLTTLYFSDQTRTVFKGEPIEPMKRMYETVLSAQEGAIAKIKAGVNGHEIHEWVHRHFEHLGYPTNTNRRPVGGFIHSLGHGVGIDIHEEPQLGGRDSILEAGHVVTVEPGLYYSIGTETIPVGGIRIEDIGVVADNGFRNLTQFPKKLEEMIIS